MESNQTVTEQPTDNNNQRRLGRPRGSYSSQMRDAKQYTIRWAEGMDQGIRAFRQHKGQTGPMPSMQEALRGLYEYGVQHDLSCDDVIPAGESKGSLRLLDTAALDALPAGDVSDAIRSRVAGALIEMGFADSATITEE